jgi:hypothetical protein
MTGDAVDHGGGGGETRRDPVVAGLAQHDPGDGRPLAVDPADRPKGEAAAGRGIRAGLDADKPVVPQQCVGVVHFIEITPEEADAVAERLYALVQELRERGAPSPGADRVLVSISLLPWLDAKENLAARAAYTPHPTAHEREAHRSGS